MLLWEVLLLWKGTEVHRVVWILIEWIFSSQEYHLGGENIWSERKNSEWGQIFIWWYGLVCHLPCWLMSLGFSIISKYPEVELLDHINSVFDFFEEPSCCFPQQLHHFISHHQYTRAAMSAHPCQHLFCFFDSSHPHGWEVYSVFTDEKLEPGILECWTLSTWLECLYSTVFIV